MARISTFRRDVDAFNLGLQGARGEIMAQAAYLAFADAQAINRGILGYDPSFEQIVDGRQDAPLESVKPGGTIIYLFAVGAATLTRAVDDLFRIILRLSPIGHGKDPHPGLYRENHLLFVNGERRDAGLEVNATLSAAVQFAETDLISVVNLLPYSRRIERGWSAQAPDGVYESAYAAIRARYGNILRLSFGYQRYAGRGPRGPLAGRGASANDAFPTISLAVK